VKRLPKAYEEVVRNVHDGMNAAQAHSFQAVAHPGGGLRSGDVFHVDASITGYSFAIRHFKGVRERQGRRHRLISGPLERSPCQDSIFPGNTPMAEGIPAVGCRANLQDEVFVIAEILV
jgi:hypothetical protein